MKPVISSSATKVGILLLENSYLDIPGAMRHPETIPDSVQVVVRGVFGRHLLERPRQEVADAYREAALSARNLGASLLTTNCGLAVVYQDAVGGAGIPAITSSLLMVPTLARVFGKRLGVLTYRCASLTDDHRAAAGWPPTFELPLADVSESSAWGQLALDSGAKVDLEQMRSDLLEIAEAFVAEHELEAMLLECTGMFPFTEDLADALDVPVYDLVGFIDYLTQGRRGRRLVEERRALTDSV